MTFLLSSAKLKRDKFPTEIRALIIYITYIIYVVDMEPIERSFEKEHLFYFHRTLGWPRLRGKKASSIP